MRNHGWIFLSLWLSLTAGLAGGFVEASEPVLEAGLAYSDMTPPVGVPLAGFGGSARRIIPFDFFRHPYATYLKPSEGIHDLILAKALYLRKGTQQLVFISHDMIGADRRLRKDVAKKLAHLGLSMNQILISGSHTHSGPGAFTRNWAFELIAADRFNSEVYEQVVNRTVLAVERAHRKLEPAVLFEYSFEARDIQRNRRGRAGHFDPTAQLLLVKNSIGQWLGGIVNLAIHGTALDGKNLRYSADVAGGIRRKLEAALAALNGPMAGVRPNILFINGAEGDVAPIESGHAGIESIGTRFAAQALSRIDDAAAIVPDWQVRTRQVNLGAPHYPFSRACTKTSPVVSFLLDATARSLIWTAFPRKTQLTLVQLGDLAMMTWPGEPTTTLGLELRRMAMESGFRKAWVLGLTNDHLSYFTAPDEYAAAKYEGCNSLYGPQGGLKIIDQYRALINH